jgi:hypothetical protein
MSSVDLESLARLLFDYFAVQGRVVPFDHIKKRLDTIQSIDDLTKIDRDMLDQFWKVVPQITMHRFGLDAFKSLKPLHTVRKSFVFIHPDHEPILGQLKEDLQEHWSLGAEIKRRLTPELISSLYGGYQWHSAYAAGCRYRGSLEKPATFLILEAMDQRKLESLVFYKNNNRKRLAAPIVVDKSVLGQDMNAIINAFHCPDVVENARQLISLGLIELSEIQRDDMDYWRS